MRYASIKDKEQVIAIITATFIENPAVRWMLKKHRPAETYLRRLALFVFHKALRRKGILISENGKGVAVFYKASQDALTPYEFLLQAWFAFTSMPLSRIPLLLRREAHRKRIRPAGKEYIYFWFLGVIKEGGAGAGFELKNAVFDIAYKERLPVYLETSVYRNKQVYEKMGFTTYHEWIDEAHDIHFWFMHWFPEKKDPQAAHP